MAQIETKQNLNLMQKESLKIMKYPKRYKQFETETKKTNFRTPLVSVRDTNRD